MSQENLHQNAPTKFVDAGGIRFAFRRFGNEEGVPLVFFQHFTGTMDNWDPLLTNRLAEGRPVVLFDNAGIGRSTGKTPTNFVDVARDALAFIGTLDAPLVDLFGFSIGGFVAQEVALQAPHLVRRIILAGTGPQGGEGMEKYSPEVDEILTRRAATPEERQLALFFAPTDSSQAAGRAWLERVASRKQDREPPSSEAVASAQLQAIQDWGKATKDRAGHLQKIKQPVLVMNGKDDIMVPTINSFILQQELPNAELILYPDSGHAAQFQYPEAAANESVRFLAGRQA
jgi:pimeloyl-ACP methyl ester carboxylesterase